MLAIHVYYLNIFVYVITYIVRIIWMGWQMRYIELRYIVYSLVSVSFMSSVRTTSSKRSTLLVVERTFRRMWVLAMRAAGFWSVEPSNFNTSNCNFTHQANLCRKQRQLRLLSELVSSAAFWTPSRSNTSWVQCKEDSITQKGVSQI